MTEFQSNRPLPRWGTAVGLLLTALPVFAQYNANDITPPTANNGKLTGAANGKQAGGTGNGHAVLLSGNALTSVDLHPLGYANSIATSTDDTQQCGYGYSYANFNTHALLWAGSSSFVDLHNGFNTTYCLGTGGGQQVGFGETGIYTVSIQHAMLWNSTSAYVDLHPVGAFYSKALGVKNGQQVGYTGSVKYPVYDYGNYLGTRATVWTGTAASAVDLNPTGYDSSAALATNGTQQGGWGHLALSTVTHMHAMLWTGTAASAVDLNPVGFTDSRITALTDTKQVGDGWVGIGYQVGSVRHALAWSGTPDSVVDLNQYLPLGYTNAVATGVDASGNVVGYAYNASAVGVEIPSDAIAVIFAPGQASPTALSSFTVTPTNVPPGGILSGTVSIPNPAPAGGTPISFFSPDQTLIPTPTPVTIPEGQTSTILNVSTGGGTLQVPTTIKFYATDGAVSRYTPITITPVVNLASLTINPVEGGFNTAGTITLTVPAQLGGATVSLTSSNPALASVPASITLPKGSTSASFAVTTSSVTAATIVPVTATLNGQVLNTTLALSPAPVVGIAGLTFAFPSVVGGQSVGGTVTLNNFSRDPGGAVITLISATPATLQLPATVTVPYGAFSAAFTATTTAVTGTKGITVKAAYNTSNLSTTIQVVPPPTVTIVKADYYTDTNLLKVSATTSYANSILTFGTDPNLPAIGTMSFELTQFNGSAVLPTAPAFATVWNSNGGQATMAVTKRLTPTGGGGGGTTTSPKLSVSKASKGTVTSNPAGIVCGTGGSACTQTYATGSVVTLTASPDAGAFFGGWNGACVGSSNTCTLTMNADKSVSPVFR